MMIVSHNLTAMNTQRQLGINNRIKAKSTEKLASGYRINRAADDAAGLSISEKMRRQIRGLNQGIDNTQDGISLCQVADGALSEVHDMLHRITELSVQSANGTNSLSDRQAIQEEINGILAEIERISDTTSFNNQQIFKADSFTASNIIGNNNITSTTTETNPNLMTEQQALQELLSGNFSIGNQDIDFDGNVLTSDNLSAYLATMSSKQLWKEYRTLQGDLANRDKVTDIFNQIYSNLQISYKYETALDLVSDNDGRSEYILNVVGDYMNKVINESNISNIENLKNDVINTLNSNGVLAISPQISDLILGMERYYTGNGSIDTSYYLANSVGCFSMNESHKILKEDLGTANIPTILTTYDDASLTRSYIAWANISAGYNADGTREVSSTTSVPIYSSSNKQTFDVWIQSGCDAYDGLNLEIDKMNTKLLGINNIDVTTESGATNAINTIDDALALVSSNRAKIGAQQNRLEHIVNNEENIVENTTASESRIRDTDMAEEMVKYSILNILEQGGQSLMAQANHSNEGVLSLLQ